MKPLRFLMVYMRQLELLAPARNAEIGRTAILAGADAVYIGAPAFGARAAAGNSVADIASLTVFAHRFRAKVYVTLNTILFDNELADACNLVWQLYHAGVDALIVQDMAYLTMHLPPVALHASTQCDIRTPEKAKIMADAGFSQIVLPREFSTEQIMACAEAAGVPVEVFVHGALCVSYSGDCQAGCMATGRSANRGMCPQMCRLSYELVDSEGKAVAPEKHYLSLRDLNRSADLLSLIEAGASSFKIEGRLKDARYVANVTAAYSRALNDIVAAAPDKYHRSSCGESVCPFTPDLNRTFNRGYTSYFVDGRPSDNEKMASLDTPKWAGMPVGTVKSPYDSHRRSFTASLSEPLANGDGLGFFDSSGRFVGFRLNSVDGERLFPASSVEGLRPGMTLYRNNDKAFFDLLDRQDAGCERFIEVRFTLRNIDGSRFAVAVADSRGLFVEITAICDNALAAKPQSDARRKTIGKLGGTIYRLSSLDDCLGDRFIPLSVLADARRRAIDALDTMAEATYAFDRRRKSLLADNAFADAPELTYHDNVANKSARHFYQSHGARIGQPAIEVFRPAGEIRVMQTRYCIRRELGACLKEKSQVGRLPVPLFLRNPSGLYRVDCDCRRCGMDIIKLNR